MAKLTKAQTKNLTTIWTNRVAAGLVSEDREYRTAIDSAVCAATGFAKMHQTAAYNLVGKGLVRVLTTTVRYSNNHGTYRVQVLALTDAGRAAIGV